MPRSRLGELEEQVLLTVLRLGGESYAVPVARELGRLTARDVSPATAYMVLRRLEGRGLLVSSVGTLAPERGGRAASVLPRGRRAGPAGPPGVAKRDARAVGRPRGQAGSVMTARGRAPFLLRLAVRLLPEEVRAEVLGDLLEHWSRDVGRHPRAARGLWLLRQPIAALRARLRFGRDGEGLSSLASWGDLGVSRLDVKLGIRMLVKHPWLTLVVVFALGIGIPASLAPHHLIDAVLDESPPFDRGDQVVGVVGLNQESGAREPLRLGDYESLRMRLTSFASVGGRTAPGSERDLGRRPCGGRARGGDERVLVRVDAGAARAGTRAHGGGRGRRGARGGGGRLRLLALPARFRCGRHRFHASDRRRPHDGRGRDAPRFRDAASGAALAAPAAASHRLRRRPRSRRVDVRPPRGRDIERRGGRGAGGHRHPSRRAGRSGAGSGRCGGVLGTERRDADGHAGRVSLHRSGRSSRPAADRVRQRRDPASRTHGEPFERARAADGARRRPGLASSLSSSSRRSSWRFSRPASGCWACI